jgi:hypothetical protein
MFHPQRHYLTATLTLLKKRGLHTVAAAEDCTCNLDQVDRRRGIGV